MEKGASVVGIHGLFVLRVAHAFARIALHSSGVRFGFGFRGALPIKYGPSSRPVEPTPGMSFFIYFPSCLLLPPIPLSHYGLQNPGLISSPLFVPSNGNERGRDGVVCGSFGLLPEKVEALADHLCIAVCLLVQNSVVTKE